MKKNLSIIAASLLLLGLGACSEEKECSPLGDGTVKVTVYATRGEADTRSVLSEEGGNLNCAWQTGDQLLVTNANGGKLGHLELTDEATGKFEGQLVGLSEGKMNLNYFFLGTGVDCKSISEDKTRNNYTFDLSSQEGQLLSLGKYDALSASAEISVIEGKTYVNEDLQLNRHFSFAHFTLNFPEGVVLNGAPITITGLNTKATIGFADRALTEITAGTVTVEGTNGDIFIGVIPGESVAPTFKATINGKEYEGSLDSRDIAAGVYLRKAAEQGVPVQMQMVEDTGEWIDLGLPSGNLWRDRNLGAETETDFGDYYAWGETTSFNSNNIQRYKAYVLYQPLGVHKNYQNTDYDTAHLLLPGTNTPSQDDWVELVNNCDEEKTKWTTKNSVAGVELFFANGKSIFLPAAGSIDFAGNKHNIGDMCVYWSSDFKAAYYPEDSRAAYIYMLETHIYNNIDDEYFYTKTPIRPIKKK